MERADPDKPPKWILSKKAMIPDFLTKDPTTMPVWEITGKFFFIIFFSAFSNRINVLTLNK